MRVVRGEFLNVSNRIVRAREFVIDRIEIDIEMVMEKDRRERDWWNELNEFDVDK